MVTRTPNISLAKPEFDRRQWQDLMNDNMTVIDALWAKYFSTTGLVGVWQNATAYAVDDLVVDETAGTIWRCTVAHTSPSSGTFLASRTASPTYWSNYTIGVRYKGAWSSAATYAVGDFVVASSSYFAVANVAHTAASAFALDQTAGRWEVLIDTSTAISSINAAVSSAATYASAAAAAASQASAAAGSVWLGTPSGTNALSFATTLPTSDGAEIGFEAPTDNTDTVTLRDLVGTGYAVKDAAGNDLVAGDLLAGRQYKLIRSSSAAQWEFGGPASIAVGKHVFPVHANALILNNGSSPTTFATITATNGAMINGLAFGSTGAQYAEFDLPMPKSLLTAGTLSYRPRWTATVGTSAATCIWQLSAVGIGDGDTLDAAQGTAVDSSDLFLGALKNHIAPESGTVTIGSFSSEDTVRFRINRKITGNTLAADAILLAVEMFLTISKRSDR